jgi:hyaluronan synthase
MALGAVKARGEILIYVDSDSFVERQSIYNIVQPFTDPTIGAVAGHIQVIVNPTQILSKMERVRYFVSHRIIKACESMFGAVTCCSGAFSAYRRNAVMRVLSPWLNQTFLGARATFGDDRSLTNHVLRHHQVIFSHDASCWTFVPDRWSKFFRQQLRWKKSWTRETLAASRIMWRKHPVAAFSYYMGVVMTLIAPFIVLRALVFMPLVAAASAVPYMLGLILVYLFFCLVFRYHTESRYWLHGLGFAVLYIGVLCWQNYYAMVTVNRTHWGTR